MSEEHLPLPGHPHTQLLEVLNIMVRMADR